MAHTVEINSLKSLVTSLKHALEQKDKSQRRLNYIATHDVLTGLRNRYALKKRIEEYFSGGQFESNKNLIFLLMDLTHFKDINDTLGHDVGDYVLRLVAKKLTESLPADVDIYRLGGDEFAVVLQDENNISAVSEKTVLEKLIGIFRKKYRVNGNSLRIGASVGICIAPKDAKTPQELIKRADIAMYEAKHSSRQTTYKYFDSRLERELKEKKILEQSILDMIQTKDFDVYFQPKIETNSERITGIEALMRAKGNANQRLSAAKVIQVAEENNLIVSLGDIIIEKSFQFLQRLKQEAEIDINLAINISSLQIRDGFIEKIESYLCESSLSFSDITIEITERLLIDRPEFVRERLNYFHSKGIGISIDDFGTGHSSLSYLHIYPFNELKIDRSFISEIENNDIKKKIVIGIIQLAHAIDLKVVAEGVETESQYRFLKSVDCDYVQGHLFYPALPAEKMLEVIKSQSCPPKLISAKSISV
jgi:diguanylate cyclase (GGDEF)-like protein